MNHKKEIHNNFKKMDNLHFIKMTINSVRMNGPDKDIRSRAAPEDIKKPEDKQA